jgi:hypothetical protein
LDDKPLWFYVEHRAGHHTVKGAERGAGTRLNGNGGSFESRMNLRVKVHIEESVGSSWKRRCENYVPRHTNKLLNCGKQSSGLSALEAACLIAEARVTPAAVSVDLGRYFATSLFRKLFDPCPQCREV